MFTVNPFIYTNLAYDPQKDFTYISLTARAPLFLAVPPSSPANTFAEFVQMVKASPGKYSYGSSGIGSIHHLTFETIKAALGLDIVHVPYKGTGQSIPAVVSGDVAAVWSAFPSIAGFAKEGKLKLIAVNSEKRSGLAPSLATIAETHIPGFDFAPIIGFIGQAGLAPAIAQKVSADVAEVLKDKALAERMTVLGIEPVGSDPATFAAQIAADRERFSRAVKAASIKAN
jgi:tripartite-type tricarboxylate transporter receptor subunit TctC